MGEMRTYNANGSTRTFFKPEEGIFYWYGQVEEYGGNSMEPDLPEEDWFIDPGFFE